jgi:hypothetical protein
MDGFYVTVTEDDLHLDAGRISNGGTGFKSDWRAGVASMRSSIEQINDRPKKD